MNRSMKEASTDPHKMSKFFPLYKLLSNSPEMRTAAHAENNYFV
jgi:hypothetical protein